MKVSGDSWAEEDGELIVQKGRVLDHEERQTYVYLLFLFTFPCSYQPGFLSLVTRTPHVSGFTYRLG